MKKVILSLVFILAIGVSFINANQSNETSEMVEEYGCASDCVSASREGALWEEGEDADRSAGGALVTTFKRYYAACLATQC
ncbi:hypothetical protein [Polaribacter sp. R77954]|uniref:hypothetical protein n=1 Tax=Polaribacter sp. R77954 TaxID=3093870 RepID=UPI0037C99B25